MAIALFGLFVMGIGSKGDNLAVSTFFLIVGALIIAAACGVVEVLLALYYRRRRTQDRT